MKDIENFINNHREEFDSEEIKKGWDKIESKIKQKKSNIIDIKTVWWAAAASLIIFFSASIYYLYFYENKNFIAVDETVELPAKELTDEVDPTYTYQMDQFAHLIKLKQTELTKNAKNQPQLYQQFLKDNDKLDSSYDFLKSKLSVSPNKEVLLEEMIENLQIKLELLNRQVQIIKQSKNKKQNNESKSI